MDFDAERAGVIQLVESTLIDHGFKRLERKILVRWNPKLENALAVAHTRGQWGRGGAPHALHHEIELSQPAWPVIPHRDRYETVLHELAHILVSEIHGPVPEGHGVEWAAQMRVFGLKPDSAHGGFMALAGRCKCRTRFIAPSVAFQVSKKVRAGGQYRCRKCKQIIKFDL